MCPRCRDTCMVPVEHNGVRTMDACPACTRRAEAEWQALTLPAPRPLARHDDEATRIAAE